MTSREVLCGPRSSRWSWRSRGTTPSTTLCTTTNTTRFCAAETRPWPSRVVLRTWVKRR
ncbi:rCG54401, isoform CRA_b [Rattus norvegicus]|uniref:RCG54401, isoform CRA_b n=1 Tax=Rattus norvegicus TaxID=10116 RepID=A6JAV9_RAT|nr:rCG54401, isoform CRA_b [Rattus norvegicus]